ncbi:heat-inducible transcriptional repressor HrcA [Pseudalkalibacillus caeni]|uniref:Heat-inducible transcription repressor HrcA n=1 Tax=Exobacillus caeni TaxID=2574798 RepID=A0A5R9F6W6_9BACL|nr:heat-inducible transcriptional repressor HrcA [Pseudalkalibacillus caeni]TLS39347.1 heat-inducible transcriptional repressor HrcA [Pseudalkalibacillus caeni]
MLTERQLFILQLLIDDYIRSAEPVGSRALSKREDVTFSSATIRNELADLEEMGFLEKTHSSSGRIPSEKGYRFYVDHLMMPPVISKEEIYNIKDLFAEKMYEVERVIQQSAKILSELTNYTAIILGPEIFDTRLKHLQIVPISKDTAVVILVANTGHVENRTITLPDGMKLSDIEKMINILNERLKDIPLVELKSKIFKEIANVLKQHIENYHQMDQILESIFNTNQSEKVFYGGKTNILTQPEFKDINKVRSILNTFEQEDIIYRLLRSEKDGIDVKIGQENNLEAIKNCSVITASYSIGGKHMGSIAVLGPTRMQYHRAISLLDYLSKDLSNALTKRYQTLNDW